LHTVHHTASKKNLKTSPGTIPLTKIFNEPDAQPSEVKDLSNQTKEAGVTVIYFISYFKSYEETSFNTINTYFLF
jgi:hypothetical protein